MTLSPEEPTSPRPSDILSTACTTCRSQLSYRPGTTSLVCDSCGTQVALAPPVTTAITHSGYDVWTTTNAGRQVASLGPVTMKCEGCGAVTDAESLGTRCQFCASNLVALTSPGGLVVPDAIVPFKVDAATAHEKFRTWVGHQFFGVKELKDVRAAESLVGTYLPYWTVSADSSTEYSGQRGVDHVERRTDGTPETRTSWSRQAGTVQRRFDDMFIPGKEPDEFQRVAFSTLSSEQLVAYRPEYLAGFTSARYEIDPAQAVEDAKSRMSTLVRSDVKRAIGGDQQRIDDLRTAYSSVVFRLVLVPMWMATFMFAGRRWPVYIDGRTGAVYGRYPVNRLKMALFVAAMFAVVILAVLLFIKVRG